MISNIPERHDLVLYRGDSFPMAWQVADDETGVPVNITGRTYAMTIRNFATDELIGVIAGVITNAGQGQFSIDVLPATTESLEPSLRYKYDIRETNGTIVRTLVTGRLGVVDDVAEAQ